MAYASLIETELRTISDSGVMVDAMRMAWIVTYVRPFTPAMASDGKCKKWLAELDAEIESYLKGKGQRHFEVHKAVIDERNQLVGHADWKHHTTDHTATHHSTCFKTYTHAEFNKLNLLMESFLKAKLAAISTP